MRFLTVTLLILAAGLSTAAQGQQPTDGIMISPVISEGHIKIGKKGHGEFTVYNNKEIPISVILSSGVMVQKEKHFTVVQPSFNLKLDQTSAKIGAHQQWTFGYDTLGITEATLLVFNLKISGPHADTGASVAMAIPVLDFVCVEKVKDCRETMLTAWGMNPSLAEVAKK